MALIPLGYLNAVVALGIPTEENTVQYIATGFLYGHPSREESNDRDQNFKVFLVTNRHVVEGSDVIVTRFNRPLNRPSQIFPIESRATDGSMQWTIHPGGADVAIIPISIDILEQYGIEVEVFRGNENAISLEEARQLISEGDGVFVLGFPMGLAGEERNYTIVRHGTIARIQDWFQGNPNILIDSFIFPGNSGGPVVTKPEQVRITDTQSIMRSLLIGMVSSYIPYEEIAISEQTGRRRMVFQENSGLAVVVPIDVIQETVDYVLSNPEKDNE